MKAHKKPQDNTMKKLLITVRNFFLKKSLIKYSWLEIQKMINKLIQQIGRAHFLTPLTATSRMTSSA